MIELHGSQLAIQFEDVHPEAKLTIDFHREEDGCLLLLLAGCNGRRGPD